MNAAIRNRIARRRIAQFMWAARVPVIRMQLIEQRGRAW